MVQGWQHGQMLQASVKQASPAGSPLLEINGKLLQAKTQQTLQAGQRLQLEVTRTTTHAVLKLLNAGSSDNASKPISLPPPASHWQAGQIVQATVIQHPARAANNTVGKPSLVRIGGNILPLVLPAQTAHEIPPGQNLRLEIINPGQLATLRVLSVSSSDLNPEQAIRDALPRQLPLTAVLANLQAISNTAAQRSDTLPADVQQQIQQLLAQLPQHSTIKQAEGLQQAMAHSGLFLEAQLSEALRAQQPFAQTTQAVAGDLKGGLLGLLSLLLGLRTTPAATDAPRQNAAFSKPGNAADTPPPLPNSQPFAQARVPANAAALLSLGTQNMPQLLQMLLRQVDGGIARIQLSQLASVNEDDDGKRSWLLDLPLRHGEQIDVLQIRIEEEKRRRNRHNETLWHVTLAFELEGLGAIHVRVNLGDGSASAATDKNADGKKVSATFWAEENHTAELFRQHMAQLQQRLREVGLNVGSLTTHHGTPPPTDNGPALPYVLLDLKA